WMRVLGRDPPSYSRVRGAGSSAERIPGGLARSCTRWFVERLLDPGRALACGSARGVVRGLARRVALVAVRARAALEPVLVDLPLQREAADAEVGGGLALVAARSQERGFDRALLEIGDRGLDVGSVLGE